MGYSIALLVLLANPLVLKCQEELLVAESNEDQSTSTGNPNYSFSYGVADVETGDMKTVWEAKEGDTVKGHYSVLEADGSMRTVEYSANPKTGFTAVVNNDGAKVQEKTGRSMEEKALRDYGKFYDFSEDANLEPYVPSEMKRKKHPFDTVFKDYSAKKRPKYPIDLESSDFSHSITIKHPRDQTGSESESHSHSHFGIDFDPNCKTKHKTAPTNNLYTNVVEFDPTKPHDIKYPLFSQESFNDNYEKYEPTNIDYEKLSPFGSKIPKLESSDYEKYLNPYGLDGNIPKFEDYNYKPGSIKYPFIPDVPEGYFPDDIPTRPKKKHKHHKKPEYQYPNQEFEDYWVPKKKKKTPPRLAEPDFVPDLDEYRPRFPTDGYDDDEDDRPHRGKPKRPTKDVVRKIVKKRKPGFNILDILDI